MASRHPKVFRDPVHNVISYESESELGRLMLRLIDTQAVQRLRHVRQLGLASLVYHGAEHSRFAHSMGAAFLAEQIFDAIHRGEVFEPEQRLLTVVAALLHDLGHAPFSHAFESTFIKLLQLDATHESITRQIILWEEGELFRVLADHDATLPARLARFLAGQSGHYTEPIVSSQLDADRMDYLLRDGYMTGVKNYHYDSARILEMLAHDTHGLLVERRALQAVESYLLSRYHMYQQVYHHKTVRAAEKLLEAVFRRVIDLLRQGHRGIEPGGPLGDLVGAALKDTAMAVPDYLRVHDAHMWAAFELWSRCDDPILAELCSRLQTRRLFKTIDVDALDPVHFQRSVGPELEEIVRKAGFEPRYYASVDLASDAPFAPWTPEPNALLPFAEPSKQEHTSLGQAIRIRCGQRLYPIEELSDIARALSTTRSQVLRFCVPAEARPAVRKRLSELRLLHGESNPKQ